jgi:hypothetical protein
MVEKKVILCAVLAIAIGIATVIPMEYLMAAQAQEATQTAQAQAKAQAQATAQATYDPWFQINVPYIYVNLHQSGGNDTMTWDGVLIQGVANFTFAPEALALNNTDARIEFYQFQVSSENGPILNMTYSIAVSKTEYNVPGIPGGMYSAITGSGDNTFDFADGTIYKAPVTGDCMGGTVLDDSPQTPIANYTCGVLSDYIASYNGNSGSQVIAELRSAQTLYIDVTRAISVAFEGNATTATTTTMSSSQILQHIELTKISSGFVYGTYVQGSVPFPMETP